MFGCRNRAKLPSRRAKRSRVRVRRGSLLLSLLIACVLTVTLLAGWVSAKEEKPKPKPWHIDGIVAALEDDRPGVKLDG